MGLQYLGDVVQGFNESTDSIRQRNQRDAEMQQERDTKVFDALANSDDPEIRAAAVTGLLTGNHPARALDKFLGKVQQHPAYETIKGLIGQGHQAFPGETEGTRLKTEANVSGGISGALGGAEHAGVQLTPEQKQRIVMGRTGAAERTLPLQHGNITHSDGSTVGGSYNQTTGEYLNEWGQPDNDVVKFQAGNAGSGAPPDPNAVQWDPGTIADTGQFAGEKSAGGWKVGHKKVGGAPVHEPAQPPPEPVPAIVNTPTGNVGVTRGGREAPLPASARGGRAVTPQENASTLRAAISTIEREVPTPTGILGSGASMQARTKAARDVKAKALGYDSYDALLKAYGDATAATGDYVPPAQAGGASAPPGPVATPGAGRGRTPPKAPAQQPAAPVDPNDPAGLFNR